MCSLLGVSRAASLTFTHSPGPTSRPFETGLLVFPFLVGSLRREDGCPIHDGGDDEEEDGFLMTTVGNNGGRDGFWLTLRGFAWGTDHSPGLP